MYKPVSLYLPPNYEQEPDAFSWPVSRDDVVSVRNRFIQRIIQISQKPTAEHHRFYPVLSLLWVNHIIQSFHLLLANARLDHADVTHYLSGDTGFMRALHEKHTPETPAYIPLLETGLPKHNAFLESLRGIKRLCSSNPLSYKPFSLINFEKDIVVSSVGELILRHAKSNHSPVYYVPRNYWFHEIQEQETGLCGDTKEFLQIIHECFGHESRLLTPFIEEWLSEIYTRTIRSCSIHTQRLLDNPDHLPKNLWIGSGGVIWDRIMKFAVKENGGQVTGHDHGNGIGNVKSISRALSECNDCDYFVTFAPNQEIFSKAIDNNFLFSDLPKIISLQDDHSAKDTPVNTTNNDSKINKVLVIPYGPDGNTARFIVTPHDSVKSDLLAQTLQRLKEWGYSPCLKPHPDCPLPLSQEYLEQEGVELFTGSIDDAFNDTDAFLFLHCYTTTFRESFVYHKPIALIDSGYEEWIPKSLEKIKKRCTVIPSNYDNKNRITLDWNQLHSAISPDQDQ